MSSTASTTQTQPPQGQPIVDLNTGNPTMQMVQWEQRIQAQVNYLTAQIASLTSRITALENVPAGSVTTGTG